MAVCHARTIKCEPFDVLLMVARKVTEPYLNEKNQFEFAIIVKVVADREIDRMRINKSLFLQCHIDVFRSNAVKLYDLCSVESISILRTRACGE